MAMYFRLQKFFVTDADPFVLTMWCSMATTAISVILMLITEEPVLPSDLPCMLSLLGHCISIAVAANIVSFIMKTLPTPLVNILQSLNLVSLIVLQCTLMRNIVPAKGNWLEALGAVLCLFGSIGGTVYEMIKQNYAEQDEREFFMS